MTGDTQPVYTIQQIIDGKIEGFTALWHQMALSGLMANAGTIRGVHIPDKNEFVAGMLKENT